MENKKSSNFATVGELKNLLKNVDDDKIIICQVIAEDNSVWNMFGSFSEITNSDKLTVIQFKHPELKTLKNI